MGAERIQPGQVWIADLYGREVRVLVVGAHSGSPETWICEKLSTKQGIHTGPHILLNRKDFVRLESPGSEVLG